MTQPPTPPAMLNANQKYCHACGAVIHKDAEICPHCGVRQLGAKPRKDKLTAGLLALFLGGLGIHHFYMGHNLRGLVYLLLCWTFIPAIAAFVEGIAILTASDETFQSWVV